MHSLCTVELRVTVTYVKMFSVAQKCSYGNLMTLATMKLDVGLNVTLPMLH